MCLMVFASNEKYTSHDFYQIEDTVTFTEVRNKGRSNQFAIWYAKEIFSIRK